MTGFIMVFILIMISRMVLILVINLGMIMMTIFVIVFIHFMIQGKIMMTMIIIMTICIILFILVTSQGMIMMTMVTMIIMMTKKVWMDDHIHHGLHLDYDFKDGLHPC